MFTLPFSFLRHYDKVSISSNQTDLDLSAYLLANSSWNGVSQFYGEVIIASGVDIYPVSGTYGLDIGTFPQGGDISIVNNGNIYGKAGAVGAQGGTAMKIASQTDLSIDFENTGLIAGGGGGGGTGSSRSIIISNDEDSDIAYTGVGGSGGIGGDRSSASGTAGASGTSAGNYDPGDEEEDESGCTVTGGSGGTGGNRGVAGTAGTAGSTTAGTCPSTESESGAGAGGAGGFSIDGISLITYTDTGTTLGSTTN
jgi:hypothetical protein